MTDAVFLQYPQRIDILSNNIQCPNGTVISCVLAVSSADRHPQQLPQKIQKATLRTRLAVSSADRHPQQLRTLEALRKGKRPCSILSGSTSSATLLFQALNFRYKLLQYPQRIDILSNS